MGLINYAKTHPKDFESITSGINNIFLTLAIVMGGIWAYFTFYALYQEEIASTVLQKEKLLSKQQAILDISIDHKLIPPVLFNKTSPSVIYAKITILIKNNGNRNTIIDITNSELTLTRLDDADKAELEEDTSNKLEVNLGPAYHMRGKIILGTESSTALSFVVKLKEPGLYFAKFSTPIPKKELNVARELGVKLLQEGKRVGSAYLEIQSE